jgi:hypothetical protein
MVEQSRQLLISNLDLAEDLRSRTLGDGAQFFKLFPRAMELKLSTALRMNAAFPIVSPAVNLPVEPPVRAIDAGYLENYGVGLATAWLDRHREWLEKNTAGVALVQIRAYAPGVRSTLDIIKGQQQTPLHARLGHRIATSLQWLTTPFDTFTTTKKAAMIDSNDSKVDALQEDFKRDRGDRFFRPFLLQCEAEAPLGWSLTDPDRASLDESLETKENRREFKAIHDFLDPSSTPNKSGPSSAR